MKRVLMPAMTLTTLKKVAFTLLCCTVLMVFGAPAQTLQTIKADPGTNEGPPAGAILDLSGLPIPGGGNGTYQQYTVNFTAAVSSTAITFAFREDPSFISFTNASVVDVTTPSNNLLVNGDFSGGTYTNNGNSSAPIGWTYANQYGATSGGIVESGSGFCYTINDVTVNYCWYDGAVQAYDAISQTIGTNVGDTYTITFWVADSSGCSTDGGGASCNFSDTSTNGDTTDPLGNGINVTVYAQAGLPPPSQDTLTVTGAGAGNGTVMDVPYSEIDCTITAGIASETGCTANYPINTNVVLTATPADDGSGSTFGGWGGACASYGTTSTCTVTMSMAQNVVAIFNVPGPTQAGTVNSTTPLVLSFNGGITVATCATDPTTCGYDATALLTGLGESPETLQVTAVTSLTPTDFLTQAQCNQILSPTFPGAQCFVLLNGDGPGQDGPVLFAYTCPGSQTGGTCGSSAQANFFASIGSDFYFSIADNPGLALAGTAPNQTLVSSTGGPPLVALIKFVGASPLLPCNVPSNYALTSGPSNQISNFVFSDGNPIAKPIKGDSGGTGSCWMVAYNVLSEAPTVSITSPVNGFDYQQGQATSAAFTCATVNEGSGSATGPYLTQASCSATDSVGGSVSEGGQFDTSTLGPHTFTATVVDSATNTVSQTVTYNVVAATDVAILNLAAPTAATGSKLTYYIGVGDLGPANAVNVVVSDTLAPGTSFLSASGKNVACSIVNKKLTCPTTPVPCAFANGAVSCNVGTIMPLALSDLNGALINVTVRVTATGTIKNPTILNNTATVSASNADTKPSNGSSTATTKVY